MFKNPEATNPRSLARPACGLAASLLIVASLGASDRSHASGNHPVHLREATPLPAPLHCYGGKPKRWHPLPLSPANFNIMQGAAATLELPTDLLEQGKVGRADCPQGVTGSEALDSNTIVSVRGEGKRCIIYGVDPKAGTIRPNKIYRVDLQTICAAPMPSDIYDSV